MISALLILWIFYICFVLYAGAQYALANKKWAAVIPLVPFLLLGGIIDVVFNQTIGRLMFWEWTYTLTFSERLDLHYHEYGWRGRVLARPIGDFIDWILPHHIY